VFKACVPATNRRQPQPHTICADRSQCERNYKRNKQAFGRRPTACFSISFPYLLLAISYSAFTVLQFLVVAGVPSFLSKKLFDNLVLP
jgi:hypothetical protein